MGAWVAMTHFGVRPLPWGNLLHSFRSSSWCNQVMFHILTPSRPHAGS